jgi:hypothetical protein
MIDACQNVLSYIAEVATYFHLPVVCIFFDRQSKERIYFDCIVLVFMY